MFTPAIRALLPASVITDNPNPDNGLAVYNPATDALLATVPAQSAKDAELAITQSAKAFASWRHTTAAERADLLTRWYDLIMAAVDDLALLITLEQGKPLEEARGEIRFAASFIHWNAGEARRIQGDTLTPNNNQLRYLVTKQPIGVTVAITPWNFPAGMIARKAAPALAAGCTMVIKPAEQTPLTAYALVELAKQAGIPADVLSIVTGDPSVIGPILATHPLVRKITFTGSTEIGRLLMRQASDTIKKVSLELGGNAPFIVCADADIDAAVTGLMRAKFRNSGQTCICANRVFVAESIATTFVAKLKQAMQSLVVGRGDEAGVTMGPLIDKAAIDKVTEHVNEALQQGAVLVTGGEPHPAGKTFYTPTLLTNVKPSMAIAKEETFGPVIPIITFTDLDEAIRMANDTIYGLAAYFYTQSTATTFKVAEALEYGMVGINTGLISNEVAPFGGMKQSGIGREGGHYAIDSFLETKYWCLQLP